MCTAITIQTMDHYFGRTLDYEHSFDEEIVVTPRNYVFEFRHEPAIKHHYAMIGMAKVSENYPLYFDAVNEKGLGIAGLNFAGNAAYRPECIGKTNLASFEWIPWLLGKCQNIEEAKETIAWLNVTPVSYRKSLPASPLHWMIADQNQAIVLESVNEGIRVYDNPVGVMTNNPTFDKQLFLLNNYWHLSPKTTENHWPSNIPMEIYSRGMGGLGLPGDFSSMSRFVKAAFAKAHSVCGASESESISQFFHLLETVSQIRGCVELEDGSYEKTIYTSCCNMDKGIYYYTTYENHQICAVDMHRVDLNGEKLYRYPLILGQQICRQN